MLNRIRLLTGEELVELKKEGRNAFYIFTGNLILTGNDIRTKTIEIECNGLLEWFERPFRSSFISKQWFSNKFHAIENNPFSGKKHTDETKSKQSLIKKGKYTGENNPFYGKTHTEETINFLSDIGKTLVGENNPFYGKTHTKETRKILSEKSRLYALTHLDKMSERGIKSIQKQALGRKTSIEQKIEQQLIELNIEHKYNKILHMKYQYDFIIGENILLEVQGDYWHANPLIYGENKILLNERQNYKTNRDLEKKKYAEDNGFKIYYIWETDINNGNYQALRAMIDENKLGEK